MRPNELKSRIVLEWDRWLQTQPIDPLRPTARDTLQFFCELQDRRSTLLDFRSGGHDKWQIIHAWLLGEGRVSEAVSLTRSPHRRERAASHLRAAQKRSKAASARLRRGQREDTTAHDWDVSYALRATPTTVIPRHRVSPSVSPMTDGLWRNHHTEMEMRGRCGAWSDPATVPPFLDYAL
jgi:hypothetical protein